MRRLTIFLESGRTEKWSGNERERDVCEYERCIKQECIQKKEASDVSESLRSRYYIQAKGLSKSSRKSMDRHLKWGSRRKASIASHSLTPTEAPSSLLVEQSQR
jgi:hypothetical protein